MTPSFLDQIPAESLKDWESELVEIVRTAMASNQPTRLDETQACVRVNKARPLKTRHVEISLPHLDDVTASLELARDDHEIFIESAFGTFCWQGDEIELVKNFISAALSGTLEYEMVYKKGRPKRARAWVVGEGDRQLVGEMLGWRQKPSWSEAVTNRPVSFV